MSPNLASMYRLTMALMSDKVFDMNIFAIESNEHGEIDWVKSAQSQDNYRLVKMIVVAV